MVFPLLHRRGEIFWKAIRPILLPDIGFQFVRRSHFNSFVEAVLGLKASPASAPGSDGLLVVHPGDHGPCCTAGAAPVVHAAMRTASHPGDPGPCCTAGARPVAHPDRHYNLGVYPELACTSTQKANEFEDKLHADLENFRNAGVQVICFQEVNDILLTKISQLLPKWVLHHASCHPKVVIAREETEWRQVTEANLPLFPDDPWWRRNCENKFLQVSAGHFSVRSFA
jgi:hypothetical protein